MTKFLGGTDFSFEAGMLVSGTLYYFMGGRSSARLAAAEVGVS